MSNINLVMNEITCALCIRSTMYCSIGTKCAKYL
jgi:hypothetical protein